MKKYEWKNIIELNSRHINKRHKTKDVFTDVMPVMGMVNFLCDKNWNVTKSQQICCFSSLINISQQQNNKNHTC